jgi:hypothetical protein
VIFPLTQYALPPQAARRNASIRRPLALSASRMSNSAMATLSSKLPLRIASVALTFRDLRFSLHPLIDGKRSTNIDSFSEGAVRFSAHKAFVICTWLNQFSFASSFRFGGHFVPSNVVHTKIAPRTVLELKVKSRKTEFLNLELNAKAG